MFGLVMAFQDYRLADGIAGSQWVGLRNFKYIFSTPNVLKVIRNTLNIGSFYMAVSKGQAIGMMHKKYREVVRRSKGKQDSAYSEKLYEMMLR